MATLLLTVHIGFAACEKSSRKSARKGLVSVWCLRSNFTPLLASSFKMLQSGTGLLEDPLAVGYLATQPLPTPLPELLCGFEDLPPNNKYTCAEQAKFGKCAADFMIGYCLCSCPSSGSSLPVGGILTPIPLALDSSITRDPLAEPLDVSTPSQEAPAKSFTPEDSVSILPIAPPPTIATPDLVAEIADEEEERKLGGIISTDIVPEARPPSEREFELLNEPSLAGPIPESTSPTPSDLFSQPVFLEPIPTLPTVCEDDDPLIEATKLGDVETASSLVYSGVSPNIKTCDGSSPLLISVEAGSYPLVSLLLNSGADPNVMDSSTGQLPLPLAMHAVPFPEESIVMRLLEHGADPNEQGSYYSEPPLLTAIALRNTDLVVALLNFGANPNQSADGSPWNASPLFLILTDPILSTDREIIVRMLQAGAAADWVYVDGTSLLNLAEDMEDDWLIDTLVMYGA